MFESRFNDYATSPIDGIFDALSQGAMAESFIVYIDESGDEGFKFVPGGGGSSDWFVLSAVVIRSHNDHMIRESLAGVRRQLKRRDKFPLHFRNLRH
jgi:hypothetical protein